MTKTAYLGGIKRCTCGGRTHVIYSWHPPSGDKKRRRECLEYGVRFTTIEVIELGEDERNETA